MFAMNNKCRMTVTVTGLIKCSGQWKVFFFSSSISGFFSSNYFHVYVIVVTDRKGADLGIKCSLMKFYDTRA